MDWLAAGLFVLGLILLVLGAEWLVRGASRLAAAAGVSQLVIGLTVVAFGTSAPELAVSVKSAWAGQADMAVGNVVGSNIFNVLFIVGASAAITPLVVAQQLVWRDVPLMLLASGIVMLVALDGGIGRVDGVLLFSALVAYTIWILRASRRAVAVAAPEERSDTAPQPWLASVGLVLLGLTMLVLGSTWLVDGAVAFARWAGISEVVVSLTIVAAGTSLPEVATSLTAAMRGQRDIAVGNVVGSNLFNLLGVLGISGLVSPSGLSVAPAMIGFDLPVMLVAAAACLPIFARGHLIPRWEGIVFLLYYAAYTGYLVLDATRHEAKAGYTRVMLQFVIPLTVLTMGVVAVRVWRRRAAA